VDLVSIVLALAAFAIFYVAIEALDRVR